MPPRETLKNLTLLDVQSDDDEVPTVNNLESNSFPNLETLAIHTSNQINLLEFFSTVEAPKLHELAILNSSRPNSISHSQGETQTQEETQVATDCLLKFLIVYYSNLTSLQMSHQS